MLCQQTIDTSIFTNNVASGGSFNKNSGAYYINGVELTGADVNYSTHITINSKTDSKQDILTTAIGGTNITYNATTNELSLDTTLTSMSKISSSSGN